MEDYNYIPPVSETPPPPFTSQYAIQEEEIPPLKPNNWLWQSIVAALLCCNVLGIVGIIHAAKVDVLYYNKRYSEAEKSARNAKTWTLIAFVLGLVFLILWAVMMSTGDMSSYLEGIIENNASGYNF